jgi:hypothetical protein
MVDKNLGQRCKYAKECSVYLGDKKIRDIDLTIYRNVFCNNGIKGWNNCEVYKEVNLLWETNKNGTEKMTSKQIDLKEIENPTERKILLLINKNDECLYGEIIRKLELSCRKGQELIYSLLTKGYIKYVERTPKLELAAKINEK